MPTKSILVNYVGYPNEIFNLMPDNGLANLAGCLIDEGHETVVWDCSTTDMVGRMFPHFCKEELDSLVKKISDTVKNGLETEKKDLEAFYSIENKIDEFQRNAVIKIADEISQYVKTNKIDFVGFKLWTGSGFEGSIIIAKIIKRDNPDVYIFGGGPHVDWFREMIFKVTDIFDVLAYGEGEEIITMLAEYTEKKRKLEEIPNLIFSVNGRITVTPLKGIEDINNLPLPNYDENVYLAMKDGQKIKAILIDESRGCPNSCGFCIHSIKSGKKWRMANAQSLVDKIEKIMKKYKIRTFRFAGSNPPPKLMKEIACEIIKRKLDITYTAFSYSKGMSKDCYELLKKSGCCAIAIGVESGSQKILTESINKKITTDEIRESIRMCKENKIKVIVSLIVPAPFETEQTKQETLDLLIDTRPDAINIFFPVLIPGTIWERNCEKYGFYMENPGDFFQKLMTFRVNYLYPSILWRPLDGFSMNGKTFNEISNETFEFIKKVNRNELNTQLLDQTFLVSEAANMETIEFARKARDYFSSGNYLKLKEMIKEINNSILLN